MRKIRTINFKKILLAAALTVMVSPSDAVASEYSSLAAAIHATASPRTYTLDATETSSVVLGNMGGANSTLTIDGRGNYGIHNTSTSSNTRIFVDAGQTLNLKDLGT